MTTTDAGTTFIQFKGITQNSSDGNETPITWELTIEGERVEGRSFCGAGSRYNEAMEGRLRGLIQNGRLTVAEIFDNHFDGAFVYTGTLSGSELSGSYFWTENQAVGTFSLTLAETPAAQSTGWGDSSPRFLGY